MLTYLIEEIAKCSVVWQEQLREICVVKGEYIGNGLVKGKEDLGANYLVNIYAEQLYTVRRSWLRNELTPVYVRKKLFTNEDEFCIKDTVGTYVTLGKDTLIMPKSAWKEVNLSLTTIEKFHDIMDVASLVPILPISVGSDLTNAAVYAVEKKYAQMWLYLGFATVSVVTAGLSSSGKFFEKVGIKLTKRRDAKKLPKNAKKMTIKEYEKKYGKACVKVMWYNKVNWLRREILLNDSGKNILRMKVKKFEKESGRALIENFMTGEKIEIVGIKKLTIAKVAKNRKFHKIIDNIAKLKQKFGMYYGKFGQKGKNSRVHQVITSSPEKTAEEFYKEIAKGAEKEMIILKSDKKTFNGYRVKMKDGAEIIYRPASKTGSPAISINIKKCNNPGELKTHKIHFEMKGR